MPKVSIIIATYNRDAFLRECLDSILDQSFTDYEIIVVNDGSTDDTAHVLQSYRDKVTFVTVDHCGPSVTRNIGLEMASGEYVAFHDDDDLWLRRHLELQVDFLDTEPSIEVVFGDVTLFDADGVIHNSWMATKTVFHEIPKSRIGERYLRLEGNVFDFLVRERFMTMPSLIIRRHCLDEVGPFDERLYAQVDYDLFLRLAKRYSIGYIDTPIASCRIHGRNLSGNPERRLTSKIMLWQKHVEYYTDLPPQSRRHMLDQLAMAHYELGYHYFSCNQHFKCRRHFVNSIKSRKKVAKAIVYLLASLLPPNVVNIMRSIKRVLLPRGIA